MTSDHLKSSPTWECVECLVVRYMVIVIIHLGYHELLKVLYKKELGFNFLFGWMELTTSVNKFSPLVLHDPGLSLSLGRMQLWKENLNDIV